MIMHFSKKGGLFQLRNSEGKGLTLKLASTIVIFVKKNNKNWPN